jgi:hypothetical protein
MITVRSSSATARSSRSSSSCSGAGAPWMSQKRKNQLPRRQIESTKVAAFATRKKSSEPENRADVMN